MEQKELNFDEQLTISGGSEAGQAAMYALGFIARSFYVAIASQMDGYPNLARYFY